MKVSFRARLDYFHAFTPRKSNFKNDDGTTPEPKREATFIISKYDDTTINKLNDALLVVAKGKWGDKAAAMIKAMRVGDKLALRDGDAKTDVAYKDSYFVGARTAKLVDIRDRDGLAKLNAESGRPYNGCYVIGIVDFWPQDNGYAKRINAELVGIQFVKDGPPIIHGAAATDDDFENLSDETEGEDVI